MDTKAALIILIKDSIISDAQKQQLLADVDTMSESQMKELGTAIAEQKKQQVKSADQALEKLNGVLEKIKEE